MEVKIKKLHKKAVIPKYATDGDAGMDLVAVTREFDKNGCLVYGTGLSFEIPRGYVGLVFPRSSISKYTINLTNSVGVIDSGYRGEVMVKFRPSYMFDFGLSEELLETFPRCYDIGDRVAQMIIIPYPLIEFIEVDTLSETERGTRGYGSSGK